MGRGSLCDPSRPRWQAYARAPRVLRRRTLRSGVRGAKASTYKLLHTRPRSSCSSVCVGPVQSRSRDHMRCKALQRRVFEPPYPARAPHVLMDHRRCSRQSVVVVCAYGEPIIHRLEGAERTRSQLADSWPPSERTCDRGTPRVLRPPRLSSPHSQAPRVITHDRKPSQGAFARPAVVLRICMASSVSC